MSVPKSRRGESPAEYINLAREIYVFTYNRVRRATYKGIRHMRAKLRIFRRWVDSGRMTAADVETSLVSWRGHMKRFHSYHMEQSVERLYRELFKGG